MAHVAPIYPNFARGEVSPLMFGRIDIEQYPSCLDKCRNVYIRPYGCATRISGTEFVANAKNNGKVRLLKFVFSATDSYIIECGAGYFRFYQNGGAVIKDDAPAWVANQYYQVGDFVTYNGLTYYCIHNGGAPTFEELLQYNRFVQQDVYEVPNDYVEEQLDSIQYVQIDDIIKLTCLPVNNNNATARPKELIRMSSDNWVFRAVSFVETPYLDQNTTNITLRPSATTGDSITITASSNYFTTKMVGANFWIGTKVTNSATNKDVQGYVRITAVNSSTSATAKVLSPLSGSTATKLWGEGAFSDYRGWPAVVALFDGRLYYARTPYQPRNVYGSKPYAYETFTPAVDNEDDAGINIQLATNANGDGSDIKWMIGASYLLCGTYGGEFIIRSTSDGAITPTDISARQRTNWGGEPIQPIVAGTFIHFIQRNGNKLRQFQYDYYYDAYKAVDVSIFSEHLLASPIRQMALQKNPDSIIYLMREDGKVVMLTLEQDQSVQAWSLLEDLGAKVESIQTIPSYNGNYDEVYFLMLRQTLATTLNIVSSNPSLIVVNNYSGTSQEVGIETEVLEYITGLCNVSPVQGSGGVINYNTGKYNTVASGTSYVYCYTPPTTSMYMFKPANAVWFEVVIGLSYISGYATEQCILSSDSATAGIKIYITAQNKFRLVLSDGTNSIGTVEEQTGTHTINTGSTPYLIRVKNPNQRFYTLEYSTDNGETWVTDITVSSSTMINSNTNIILGCDWDGSNYVKKFIGEIDLNKCYIKYEQDPDDPDVIPFWYGVSGAWSKDGQVVNLNDYEIGVVGFPNEGDTLNLTYVTDMSNPVRYIERITTPITSDNPNEWWYVRAGLEYNAYKMTTDNLLSLTSYTGIVEITTEKPIFNLTHVGKHIRATDSKGKIIGEGIITGHINAQKMRMTITRNFDNLVIQGGYWGISVTSISGLDHLIGQNVQVVVDGYESNITKLTTGSITFDNPAYRILAGLPYQSYITTMPMEAGSQNGTAVGKRKRISEMAIRVWNSIGVRVGRDLDHLYDTIYEQQEPYTGVIPNIKYNQGWVWDANITVEQSHPYPMNILSIAPLVTEVDK